MVWVYVYNVNICQYLPDAILRQEHWIHLTGDHGGMGLYYILSKVLCI